MKTIVNIDVAIIEDDASIRQIIAGWLKQSKGFNCVGDFPDAESAVAGLAALKPAVVLTDINLPGMSGIECVRLLKPQLTETQFLMLTVYEDAEHIFDALTAGASGYLLKRTSRKGLLDALTEVHGGGSPMTSGIARKVVQSFQQPAKAEAPETAELSQREREVLDLLARGYAFKEIADMLNIGVTTVSTYIRRIYEKLHVRSRGQAVAKYTNLTHGNERWLPSSRSNG
jgi:DNA-binding NarL/FixJ family response regulator